MRNISAFLIMLMAVFLISGCQNKDRNETPMQTESSALSAPSDDTVLTVKGIPYSIEDIQQAIQNVFNTELYYCGEDMYGSIKTDSMLNQTWEYDLLFVRDHYPSYAVLLFNNLEHPLSTKEEPKYCMFEIAFTKQGIESTFYGYGVRTPGDLAYYIQECKAKYLGRYSMCITEVTKPQHEQMSDEWKQLAEAAIKQYIAEEDVVGNKQYPLEPGKYCVYIKGFSEADQDTTIYFEHEQGKLYEGFYYFVHNISKDRPADLNHVRSDFEPSERYETMLKKIRENAALVIECQVD